jgi:hypothetical protein
MLIGGRAIAGLGSSGLQNGSFTLISGATPLHKRPSELTLSRSLSIAHFRTTG